MDYNESEESLESQLHHFMSMGQWLRARETAYALLAAHPESAWNHYWTGLIHYQLDDYPSAEKHLKKCIAEQPDMADAYEYLALVHLSMGRAGTADDYIKKSIELDPTSDSAWNTHANLCLHHDDPKSAIVSAERAISLNPENVHAKEVIIRARRELNTGDKINTKAALQAQIDLLAEDPENAYLHYGIGNLYFEMRNYPQAEIAYRKAISLDPEDTDYHQCLIRTLRKRDFMLRLLWVPYFPIWLCLKYFKFLGSVMEKKLSFVSVLLLLLCLPLIFIAKYLLILLIVSAVIFFTIFWPVCRCYEYLTIADIHKKMGMLRLYTGPMAKIHKLPFPARLGIFFGCMLTFWSIIVAIFINPTTASAVGSTLASFAGIIFLAVVILGFVFSFRESRQKRKTKQFFDHNS